MIVDTSALVAVVMQEPQYEAILNRLGASTAVAGIGSPTVVELGIVLSARLATDARALVTQLLGKFEMEVVPFGDAHWHEAVGAFWRFGRGRHQAGLNFGDAMTYAVARLADEPLLFVGDDFAATDLAVA